MTTRIWRAALAYAAMLIFVASLSAQTVRTDNTGRDLKPTGKGWGERDNTPVNPNEPSTLVVPPANGISYHGGPVMTSTKNVYVIWYGTWSSTAKSILTNMLQYEGGSPYFNINTTYYNGGGTHVSNSISYQGSTTNNYAQGKSLSDSAIKTIVSNAITSGVFPKDTTGVYFVLTASDVNETSGFCTQYCGWHTHGSISGSDIKYSFVGNPARCLSACAAESTSPNGDAGADGAASIIAHELEEAATDPDLNAWYDSSGEENADKCAWTFGTTHTASNGSKYNVTFGSRQYLIQRNWVNASGGYCAMSY
ncbi:MAG: hypothetical protein ACXVZX_04790 [Terriglobales bacterium]